MPLVFPTIGNAAEVCGADPRVCAGRPRPASGTTGSASCRVRQADEGVGRGPGGPPHHWRRRLFGKNEWHWVTNPPQAASLPHGKRNMFTRSEHLMVSNG